MRASGVLQKCLSESLCGMHALREAVLLRSLEALIVGRRLTFTDVVRAWPGAERVAAPLKAFDRLLSNGKLHGERERIYADMARWLLRGQRPVIVVDWSDLKTDRRWCLLRGRPHAASARHGLSGQAARIGRRGQSALSRPKLRPLSDGSAPLSGRRWSYRRAKDGTCHPTPIGSPRRRP